MNKDIRKHNHDWEYEVVEMWYVMVTRKCLNCGETQETKVGLSDDDFEVIRNETR